MTDGVNLRALALEVLLLSEKEGVFAHSLINDTLDAHSFLDEKERSFFKRLTEGTIERRITLDYIIDRVSSVPVQKQKSVIKHILRLGVFQLYFMASVPPGAAINEAVKLAKQRGFKNLSGFVNGVLRAADRQRIDISSIKELWIRYSCPEWIVQKLTKSLGEERTERFLKASLEGRELFLRPNSIRTTPEALLKMLKERVGDRVRLSSDKRALCLKDAGAVSSLPGFEEGLFSVQDLSSMSVGFLSDPKPGMRVLELCSAPGGKICHLAELMGNEGELTACDLTEEKTALIRENTERLGLSSVKTGVRDAREYEPSFEKGYDIVLADLPCSGLGVIGRKNEIRYRVREEDVSSLVLLQRDILRNAVRYVRPGGRLVYSVCTVTEEETGAQRKFIEEEYPLKLITEKLFLPDAEEAEVTDGMYIGVFGESRE
ncbi:MAG: 16S rRNA (cytosine(967)-C(5))-methyltransferase RsmB [Lachnospiraceae bacterium]|nr:16S rRNA (cytosine(967)-C(5))-methyltransferase RsmB [Lachnospiraceae bacterium]